MYAIVETGGKQYKVSEGMELSVEKLPKEENKVVTLDKVLLFVDKDNVSIGTPYLSDLSVKAKVLKQGLDEKVLVYKFKRKTGYHRKKGHRQHLTLLKIEKIGKGEAGHKTEVKHSKEAHEPAVKKTTAKRTVAKTTAKKKKH